MIGRIKLLNIKPLTHQEFLRLFKLYKYKGNLNARRDIIKAYIPCVFKMIYGKKIRFISRADYDDYFQEAVIGISQTLDRYDERRGVKFVSFLMRSIPGLMMRHSTQSDMIRVPARIYLAKLKFLKFIRETDDLEKILKEINISEDLYNKYFSYFNFSKLCCSLDYENDYGILQDIIPDDSNDIENLENDLHDTLLLKKLKVRLSQYEYDLLTSYYAVNQPKKTFRELGNNYGVSHEAIRLKLLTIKRKAKYILMEDVYLIKS